MPAENDDWHQDRRQLFWDGFIITCTLARTGGGKALAGTRRGLPNSKLNPKPIYTLNLTSR